MIPDDLNLPAAVLGMAVLTLVAAGLFSTYQRAQALKRLRIQRLIHGARRVESVLERLAPVSLPRDLRVLLREDIRDRYRLVARIHARYPDIARLIEAAEQRRAAEGADVGQTLPVADSAETLEQWQAAFRELLSTLYDGSLLKPPAGERRERLRTQVLERQAECVFGHFMNQADKFKTEGRVAAARSQVQQLTEWLRGLPLRSERTRELLDQAEEAYRYLLNGTVPADDKAAQAQG